MPERQSVHTPHVAAPQDDPLAMTVFTHAPAVQESVVHGLPSLQLAQVRPPVPQFVRLAVVLQAVPVQQPVQQIPAWHSPLGHFVVTSGALLHPRSARAGLQTSHGLAGLSAPAA
jgi:hypothetical protein